MRGSLASTRPPGIHRGLLRNQSDAFFHDVPVKADDGSDPWEKTASSLLLRAGLAGGQVHCTETVKLTGAPGLTKAVAVHAFGSDSVPSAIWAVAPKVCEPLLRVSAELLPVMPVTALLAPEGAAMEKSFTGVLPERS